MHYAIAVLPTISQAVENATLASSWIGWHGACESICMDAHSDSLAVKKSLAHRRPFYGRRGIGRPHGHAETEPTQEFVLSSDFGSRSTTLAPDQATKTVRWSADDDLNPEQEYSCLHFRYRLDCF